MKITRLRILIFATMTLLSSHRLLAQSTAFSYQGRLTGGGSPVDGSYELRFALFNAGTGGSQVGDTTTNAPVLVNKGLFTVKLDFGTNAFTGAPRWLEIGVRTNGGGAFRTLGTRQLITAEPYSIFATRAGAVDWTGVSGKPTFGTVTLVDTGAGLTGGPIINSGTISLDGAVVPQLGVANVFTTGPQTILSGGPPNRGLLIRGSFEQTGNLQEWQGNAGNAFASVTAAGIFTGNGAGLTNISGASLTNLDASNISAGTLADARLSANVSLLSANQTFAGANTFNGVSSLLNPANTFVGSFSGNGAGLTNLSGLSQTNINASNITSGTLADARLTANVVLRSANQTFAGSNTFNGVSLLTNVANTFVGSFSGNGAGLTNLSGISQTNINAANITSGTLPDARLSFNVPLLVRGQTFTGSNTFNGVSLLTNVANTFVGTFYGNGAGLSNLVSTGTNFGGTLAGDVTGPVANTTVGRIRGVTVSAVAPTVNQFLRFNGATWTPGGVALASDVSGTLGVANGGSGATTAAAARANFGAAASGANSDIASLTGLITPLSPTQGGSGQSSFTTGDLLYAPAANTLARRSVGAAGQVLAVSASVPVWTNANAHNHHGQSWVGTNRYGLTVQSTASNGTALYGLVNSGASGSGVFGESTATNGTGVYGRASNGTSAYGVFGEGYFGVVGSGSLYGVNAFSVDGYALFAESSGGSNAPQVALLQDNINDYCRLSIGVSGAPQWQIAVGPGATPAMLFHNGATNVMTVDFFGNVRARTFTPSSDRALKEDFASVNPREVLERVSQLPIQTWRFKEDGPTRHIGPMAQDFHAAFNVGPDDKHIATVDADGVALAAIQGLNEVVKEKDARIAALEKRLGQLENLVAALAEK